MERVRSRSSFSQKASRKSKSLDGIVEASQPFFAQLPYCYREIGYSTIQSTEPYSTLVAATKKNEGSQNQGLKTCLIILYKILGMGLNSC